MTQEQLAAAIGCAVKTVSQWENGKQDMGILNAIAIAAVLGTTVQAILTPTKLPMIRAESIFFVSPDRIARIQAARTDLELRDLVLLRPQVSIEIEPSDLQVSKQQFLDAQDEADALYDSKVSGPLKRLLEKLRGLR